jgi:hypothetical protein
MRWLLPVSASVRVCGAKQQQHEAKRGKNEKNYL